MAGRRPRARACCWSSPPRGSGGDLDAGRRNSTEAFRIGESSRTSVCSPRRRSPTAAFSLSAAWIPRLVNLLKTALARLGRSGCRLARAAAGAPRGCHAASRRPIRACRAGARSHPAGARERQCLHAPGNAAQRRVRADGSRGSGRAAGAEARNTCASRASSATRPNACAARCVRRWMPWSSAMRRPWMKPSNNATPWPNSSACLHYQWTAAAFRAMRATTRGEFAAAEVALARARRLAERAQDPNATVTLLVQQLALAEIAGDREKLEALMHAARAPVPEPAAFGHVPEARSAGAWRALAGARSGSGRRRRDVPARHVSFFRHGRLCQHQRISRRIAGACRYANSPTRAFAPYKERCGHWGMLGLRWMGPITLLGIGHLAAARWTHRRRPRQHFSPRRWSPLVA